MVKLKGKLRKDYDPEDDGGLNYEQPKPGVYDMSIHSVEDDVSAAGNEQLVVVYECHHDDYEGSRVWDYVTFSEKAEWKVDQFLYALGVDPGDDVDLDGTILNGMDLNELPDDFRVRVRIKADSYEGSYKAKVRQVSRHPDFSGLGKKKSKLDIKKGKGKAAKAAPEPEPEPETDDDELEPYTEDELNEMSLAEVKEIAVDEFELEAKPRKKKDAYIAEILEAQEADEEEPEDDDEPEEDEEGEWPSEDEVKAMPLAELKELAGELEIDTAKKRKPALIREINEAIDQLSF